MKDFLIGMDINLPTSLFLVFGIIGVLVVAMVIYDRGGWDFINRHNLTSPSELSGWALMILAYGFVVLFILTIAGSVVWGVWDFIRVEPERPSNTESTGSDWGSYDDGYYDNPAPPNYDPGWRPY